MTINASVQEIYHITDTLKQHYTQLIAGKSKQDALTLLRQQSGVGSATIMITGGDGNTLPADPTKITIGL